MIIRQRARELTKMVYHFGIFNKLNVIENGVSSMFMKDDTSWRGYFEILEISTVRHKTEN